MRNNCALAMILWYFAFLKQNLPGLAIELFEALPWQNTINFCFTTESRTPSHPELFVVNNQIEIRPLWSLLRAERMSVWTRRCWQFKSRLIRIESDWLLPKRLRSSYRWGRSVQQFVKVNGDAFKKEINQLGFENSYKIYLIYQSFSIE